MVTAVKVKADSFISRVLAEEREEEDRLRRRFHIHVLLILTGTGMLALSSISIVPINLAAFSALCSEWMRDAVDRRGRW